MKKSLLILGSFFLILLFFVGIIVGKKLGDCWYASRTFDRPR